MKTIIWYGSLMNLESAKRSCEPIWFNYWYIQWYSRIFNKLWYNPHIKKFNDWTSMLNVQHDKNIWMIISYFQISDEDYINIREREWDYNEEIVDIYDENQNLVSQWILYISKENVEYKWKNIQLLHDKIQPEKRYVDLCLDALKQTPYLKQFLETTYQSCGKKKVEWNI